MPEEPATAREQMREDIAMYASIRTYRKIMEVHGWGKIFDRLHAVLVEDRCDEMPDLITDEMFDTFAISRRWDELRERIIEW